MAEIARLAGVHQTTVSRALRNDRRLPPDTRDRIQRIAESAGYRPNALVSALVTLRRARHPARYQATLGFVAVSELGLAGEEHLAGARVTAEQLGYKVDLFVIGREDLTPERLDAVLTARGIHGLVIAPLPEAHGGFTLSWERYCAMVIEYTFTEPALDRVVHDSYRGMRMIMQECRRRRFRRVGVTLTVGGDERTEGLNGAAYWTEQKADRFFAPIPPLIQTTWNAGQFSAWFDRNHPHVVVTSNALLSDIEGWCEHRRLQPGRDVQLVNVNADARAQISGVCQNHPAIGAAAVRMVVDKLNRNDRGIPELRHTTLTPGTWIEGTTLREAKA